MNIEGGSDVIADVWKAASDKATEKAKQLMQCCIDLCCRLDREVYVRKQNFAVCKMALIDLRCESSVSRRKSISLKSIEEAKKSLDTLQSDYYSQREVQSAKIQRLIAKVDFNYRLEKYEEAEKVGQEALKMAKKLEYNLDVIPLEERLLDIHEKMAPSNSEVFRHVSGIIESSSSKNNTPYSSEFDDKLWIVFKSFMQCSLPLVKPVSLFRVRRQIVNNVQTFCAVFRQRNFCI